MPSVSSRSGRRSQRISYASSYSATVAPILPASGPAAIAKPAPRVPPSAGSAPTHSLSHCRVDFTALWGRWPKNAAHRVPNVPITSSPNAGSRPWPRLPAGQQPQVQPGNTQRSDATVASIWAPGAEQAHAVPGMEARHARRRLASATHLKTSEWRTGQPDALGGRAVGEHQACGTNVRRQAVRADDGAGRTASSVPDWTCVHNRFRCRASAETM